MQKPTKEAFEAAVEQLVKAGVDIDRHYWELSPKARAAWKQYMPVVIGYIGKPTAEQLDEIHDKGIGFPS